MMQSSFEIARPTSATGKAGRSATRGVIALVLAALVAAAASGCSRAHDSAPFPGDNGAPAAKTSSLGQGFEIRLPAGWTVEPFGPGGPDDHGCGALAARLSYKTLASVDLALPPASCSTGHRQPKPLNGHHGFYLTPADAYAPRHVTAGRAPAGAATVFDQDYTECTNRCVTRIDRVGLLHLARSVDGGRSTLMLWADGDVVSADQMSMLMRAVTR